MAAALEAELSLADVRPAADQVAPDATGAGGALLVQAAVAVVAQSIDLAGLDGRADGAAWLVAVAAVVVEAGAEAGAQLAEAPVQLAGRDAAERERADAGRVGDVAAARAGQRHDPRAGGRVAPLVGR